MSQAVTVPPPASTAQALGMLQSAMGYLAAADATAMAAETQAQCLQALERASSVGTAARTSILAAFTSGQGYAADADYSPRAWLIHKTHVTRGAAVGYTAWVRRAAAHPEVAAALAAGTVSESVARTICGWTGKLPQECQEDADAILLGAALGGADVADLAGLAGEIYARSLPRDKIKDEDGDGEEGQEGGGEEDEAFGDRCVRVETTFGGAGVLTGDLSPECASIVGTVLDALSAPAGAEDARSQPQRCHDALQEAMRRLVSAGLLPERAGQPVKAVVHMSLADLMRLEGSSALLQEWTSRVRAQWAGHRARASAAGGGGGAWLDGDAAEAVACDAAMVPFVTGEVDPGALEDLVRLCVQLDRLRHHPRGHAGDACPDSDGDGGTGSGGGGGQDGQAAPRGGSGSTGDRPAATAPDTALAWEALERAIIGKAVDLLSGRAGWRRSCGAGSSARGWAGRACRWTSGSPSRSRPGSATPSSCGTSTAAGPEGGSQPASACEVHHVKHKKNGGKTSTKDCVLLCFFHHQIVIHKWGWTLVLNPDGTTTAWNPGKTKVLHSHGPPVSQG